MSRHELYALRNQASADHGGTTTSASGTGGHAKTSAASNDAGGKANDGKPADSSGTSQAESSVQEGGDTSANTAAPVHDAGSPVSSGTLDAGVGNAVVDGSGDSGGEGQGASTLAPDSGPVPGPVPGSEPGSEPEEVSGSGDRWPGPPGDVESGPGPDVPGADGSRGHLDAGAADTGDGGQKDASGGRRNGNPDGPSGRAGDSQGAGAAGSEDQYGGKDTQPGSRTGAEVSQPAQHAKGTTSEKSADGQGGNTKEQEPRDQPPVQNSSPDAGIEHPVATSPEAKPDQHPDDPRLTAMQQQMERMQAALDDIKASYDGKLDAIEAKHQAETAQLRQKIDDLETKLATSQPEQQSAPGRSPDSGEEPALSGTPDAAEPGERRDVLGNSGDSGDDAELADTAAFDRRGDDEAGREGNRVPAKPERPDFSAESVQAGKEALGLAGTLGILPSGLPLIMAGDSVRRAFQEMPPEDQHAAINLADTAVTAFGSMSPGTAMAAFGASIIVPAMHARFRDMFHKMSRKD